MSFIYAEKCNEIINIHCDTKIYLDSFAGASFSREQIELVNKYGIVKTTIICPEISISFAGNKIYLAAELFRRLYEKRIITTQDVINMAYEIHRSGEINEIEFIIASCEDGDLSLHCIKEHEVHRDCPFAWIGSPMAHCEFQEIRNTNNNGKASDRTSQAFLEVIQGCSDDSVGGFHIIAGYSPSKKSMCYRECKTFQSSKPQMVQPGEKIRLYLDARDGGFSYEQIPVSYEDLILMFDQMDPAILYSRRLRMNDQDIKNPQLFSLMLPMLIHEDGNGVWVRM